MKIIRVILVCLCSLIILFGLLGPNILSNANLEAEAKAKAKEVPFNSVGPGGGGALYQPSFNPLDTNNFFLTCDMGSSFVTHDGGQSFQSLALGRSVASTGMVNYWFTPHDENTVFATAGQIVYVSRDKGRTWDFMFPSADDYVGMAHIAVTGSTHPQFKDGTLISTPHNLISFYAHPTDPNILYTMSSGRSHGWPTVAAELYRSTDAGKTWHVFKTFNDAPWIDDAGNGNNFAIWVDQLQGTTAQMMIFEGELRIATHQGMFRLNEQTGETVWNRRIDAQRYTASASGGLGGTTNMVVKDNKMTVYMIMWEGEHSARHYNDVYKSTDFGVTWESITTNFEDVALTTEGRTISQHFADNWFDGWAITHVTFNHIATSNGKIFAAYVGNDWRVDGIIMSEDEGKTWTILLAGTNKNPRGDYGGYANQFDMVGPVDDMAGSTSWSSVKSRGLAVNPNDPNQVITTNMAEAWMTTNGGLSWSSLASDRVDEGQKPVPLAGETPRWSTTGIEPAGQHTLAIDPFNKNHHLSGWTDIGIYESFDAGESWTWKKFGTTTPGNSHAIAFDPLNEGVILAAYSSRQNVSVSDIANVNDPSTTRTGGLARSTDGGATWTLSVKGDPAGTLLSDSNNSGLPRRAIINGIVFDKTNTDVVYVLCSGAGVYKSTDGGVTFVPFNSGVALTTNGAYQGIYGMLRQSEDGKTLILTNGGLIYKLDMASGSTTWTAINGIEGAQIARAEMDSDGVIYATTNLQVLSDEKVPFGDGGLRANIGNGGVWVSIDDGATWRQMFTDMYRVTDVMSDSRDSDILYMTSLEGKVYASDKGAATAMEDWVELEGFNFHTPRYIFENTQSTESIYVGTDCGGTWNLAIPFEEPLPSTSPSVSISPSQSLSPSTSETIATTEPTESTNTTPKESMEIPVETPTEKPSSTPGKLQTVNSTDNTGGKSTYTPPQYINDKGTMKATPTANPTEPPKKMPQTGKETLAVGTIVATLACIGLAIKYKTM